MNPRRDGKEHCITITLIGGKTVESQSKPMMKRNQRRMLKILQKNPIEAENSAGNAEKLLKNSESKEPRKIELKAPSREDTTIAPYPQRLKNKLDNQFGKFMEIFKKLHINIPFVDALDQMPSYVKFMKDILANKRS